MLNFRIHQPENRSGNKFGEILRKYENASLIRHCHNAKRDDE